MSSPKTLILLFIVFSSAILYVCIAEDSTDSDKPSLRETKFFYPSGNIRAICTVDEQGISHSSKVFYENGQLESVNMGRYEYGDRGTFYENGKPSYLFLKSNLAQQPSVEAQFNINETTQLITYQDKWHFHEIHFGQSGNITKHHIYPRFGAGREQKLSP